MASRTVSFCASIMHACVRASMCEMAPDYGLERKKKREAAAAATLHAHVRRGDHLVPLQFLFFSGSLV